MPEHEFPKLKTHPFREALAGVTHATVDARPHPEYAELCVTSNYTFLTGASHPEEFVVRAAELGYKAVAVTDTNTLAGVVRAHVAARESGLRFVLGSRLRFTDVGTCGVCVYPTDMASYRRLCRLLTTGKRRAPKGECHLRFEDLAGLSEGLLAIVAADPETGAELEADVRRLKAVFDGDRLSLGIGVVYGAGEADRLERMAGISARAGVPLVATNDAHYHVEERRMLQDVLTCIRHGCTLGQAGFRLHANAERHLKPPEEMHRLLAGYPRSLSRVMEIVERTKGFGLDLLKYEYPDEVVPAGKTPQEYLTELVWEGAGRRYPGGVPKKVVGLIEHELRLVEELSYAPYFLTVYDLVRFARSGVEKPGEPPVEGWKGEILCQGRGAAANSSICYCLGVTAVDPTRVNLLFERFVSKERNEPPDIDIDFEHERREEVIQYIYRKYGRERAALAAEVISYRRRSAVRDVGKALGLSLDLVDRLAKDVEWFDEGFAEPKRLREMGLNPDDAALQWLARLVRELLGFPRHLSQHVGGFVMTRSPLCELVPVENAAMPERTVIEWDKDDIDAAGMLKVDVLGLGMLTALRRCFDLINTNRDKGTEGQRDKVEKPDERRTYVQGSHSLAEVQGARQEGVSSDGQDARVRTLRIDQPDATSSCIDPVKHCGGVCQADDCGVPPVSPNCERVAFGSDYPVRTRSRNDDAQGRPFGLGATDGSRSSVAIPDHEDSGKAEEALVTPSSSTLSLCPSVPLSLTTIPPEDPTTYEMMQHADTVGVFQIESRAQMSMLPRLKPRVFYDLIIEVAIVRPGPIQGGMVHPYLKRRSGQEVAEPLPESVPKHIRDGVEEVLGKTFGVPLFQEQCMALAVKAAGFTPGEADQLRRAMAAWKRKGDQIYRFGAKLIEGMVNNGLPREFAERCFGQIKGFSEYGFPESHAASFALLVYASAWLKRHHPAEFTASLLNSQPMGFYAPAQLIRDAKEHGVEVRRVDVNSSAWDCTIEGGALRLGMRLVSGLGEPDAVKVREAVLRHGPFDSMLSLWRASGARARSMRRLAAADALGSMNLSRQQALWQARLLRDEPLPLFETPEDQGESRAADGLESLPALSPLRQVVLDYDATGLSLRAHPVSFARPRLDRMRAVRCEALKDAARTPEGELVTVAGLVLVRQRPGTAKEVTFMTLEDETGIANLVVWKRVYDKYRRQASARMVVATGRVQRQGEVVHVVVTRMRSLDEAVDGLVPDVRNFH